MLLHTLQNVDADNAVSKLYAKEFCFELLVCLFGFHRFLALLDNVLTLSHRSALGLIMVVRCSKVGGANILGIVNILA